MQGGQHRLPQPEDPGLWSRNRVPLGPLMPSCSELMLEMCWSGRENKAEADSGFRARRFGNSKLRQGFSVAVIASADAVPTSRDMGNCVRRPDGNRIRSGQQNDDTAIAHRW
ncbi:hypothetical protein GCM10023319_18900 [Nocardia iowensis]